jgi:hypothetical protein
MQEIVSFGGKSFQKKLELITKFIEIEIYMITKKSK